MKEEKEKQPINENRKQSGEVTRRGFLVGAGTVVVGGAIGAGLLSSCKGGEMVTTTVTSTKTVPTTITTTVGGPGATITETKTVGAGDTITVTKTETKTGGGLEPWQEPEISSVRSFGLSGFGKGGEAAVVDVKNGKIVRCRSLRFDGIKKDGSDATSTEEERAAAIWKIDARGKTFTALTKSNPNYFTFGYKKCTYSPNRIKYPLKRVDWEPGGDPAKINSQNRGISKFKRISWDEATSIVADEIKRVQSAYGAYAVYAQGDGHGQGKCLQGTHGANMRCLNTVGGYTMQVRNADSWEGWYWGAKHVWGCESWGTQKPQTNIFNDIAHNCDMIVMWGGDPDTTETGFKGQVTGRYLYYLTELGIKQVYVCPDLNYSAAVHADKWIPVYPNTDAALHLAIAYMWITEETYDKDYLDSHSYGFDKFKDYVLGIEDGVPKTPEWASPKCGVPEWTIKAFARDWASKTVTITHGCGGGGLMRTPYGHEPARLEVYLLGMQGLGKPGVNQTVFWIGPEVKWRVRVSYLLDGLLCTQMTPQFIPKPVFAEAVLDGHMETWGSTHLDAPLADQFVKYTYPIPAEEGGTEIHMMWATNPCLTGCWNNSFKTIEAFRSDKIECIVIQHPWLENDCLFADILLPTTSIIEDEDLYFNSGAHIGTVALSRRVIEPVGESKMDREAAMEIAKKLGTYEQFTEGKTQEEWFQFLWGKSEFSKHYTFEELEKKSYVMAPLREDWEEMPAGLSKFYNDPKANPLTNPKGILEYYSDRLAENFPDDMERAPVAKWVIGGSEADGWFHDESRWGERFKQYPLVLVSNHPRWRHHVQCDEIPWLREIPTCKIKGYDGYMYEPVWIHPSDAASRGIENGDIVKVFNERGIVLGGAYVTERIRPGATFQDHGARLDLITDGIDRGGSNNLISPRNGVSANCKGQATSGFLVEVAKVTPDEMEGWRKQYPDAFSRDYDPACGLTYNSWVEGGLD